MKKKQTLTKKELGTVESVLLDFNHNRLPRLLDMKKQVDEGATLDTYDLQFLSDCIEHSRGSEHFAELHPEFKRIVAQVAHLYHHITNAALNNANKDAH
ncbi:hypothetical protein [Marinibactrum halimedae]|uniref:Uncharacterized protein n=1 Tax=Marinibactrum halimedae TaxID=1444977 RepID=A0AA37T6F8_9GAMM|nr:hypothetical protein [Marinibactrum halimedae]MCD9460283.1 hypothetical protein [Marinibactrum halimedae]GLS24370.1 hypothetical protein GCM10007877_00810 [Marinibactrum halimedae]